MTSWIVPGGILLVAALVLARWLWRRSRRKTLLATPLTSRQRATVEKLVPLVARIVKEYDIPRANVVGHSDVAPARKIDPGELFPWDRLAEYGLCLPRPDKLERGDPFDNDAAFYLALERFGYDITDGHKAVEAFQRRWRPEKINGEIDGEVRAILFQLLLDRDRGNAR